MERDKLETLIDQNCTQKQMAESLGVSQSTVRHWLKKYCLKTKHKQYRYGRYVFTGCKTCGDKNEDNFHKKDGKRLQRICKICSNKKRLERLWKIKKQCVDYKGGKCEICQYDGCLAALDFHHEGDKDPNWSLMPHWSFENVKAELDRCRLLCCRCHRELHWKENQSSLDPSVVLR